MKEYFSHDYHARADEKIIKMLRSMGPGGYGIYWMIIEMLYENNGTITKDYELIAYDLRVQQECVKMVCEDFLLFKTNDVSISSDSVIRRIQEREVRSNKASFAGRLGGIAKRESSKILANATDLLQQPSSNFVALKESKGKESKGKESKGNTTLFDKSNGFSDFWKVYPRKTGKEAALTAWKKKTPPIDKCLSTLYWQIKSPQWTKEDGQYIPLPATWLNQGRWDDIPAGHNIVTCSRCGAEGALPQGMQGTPICRKCKEEAINATRQ